MTSTCGIAIVCRAVGVHIREWARLGLGRKDNRMASHGGSMRERMPEREHREGVKTTGRLGGWPASQ